MSEGGGYRFYKILDSSTFAPVGLQQINDKISSSFPFKPTIYNLFIMKLVDSITKNTLNLQPTVYVQTLESVNPFLHNVKELSKYTGGEVKLTTCCKVMFRT